MINVAVPSWFGGGANTMTFPAHAPPQKLPEVSSTDTKHSCVVHGPTGTEASPIVVSVAVACWPVAAPQGLDVHLPATPVMSNPADVAAATPELEAMRV